MTPPTTPAQSPLPSFVPKPPSTPSPAVALAGAPTPAQTLDLPEPVLDSPALVDPSMPEDSIQQATSVKAIVNSTNKSKKWGLLRAFCVGLKGKDDEQLSSETVSPWKDLARAEARLVKPNLWTVVKYRAAANVDSCIAPSKKSNNEELIAWLEEHPLPLNTDDEQFVMEQLGCLSAKQEEEEKKRQETNLLQWTGKKPHLWLIHALLDDDVKPLYLRRDDPRSQSEIDGKTGPAQRAFTSIAQKWNDPKFNPVSLPINGHFDFAAPIDLGYDKVCAGLRYATPEYVKDRVTNLTHHLRRVIRNFQQSGQGDGGRTSEDNDKDSIGGGRPLNDKASFIGPGTPTYIFYFWIVGEIHGVLDSTVARMDEDVGLASAATSKSGSVADTLQSRKRRKVVPTEFVDLVKERDAESMVSSQLEESSLTMRALVVNQQEKLEIYKTNSARNMERMDEHLALKKQAFALEERRYRDKRRKKAGADIQAAKRNLREAQTRLCDARQNGATDDHLAILIDTVEDHQEAVKRAEKEYNEASL